MNQDYIGPTPKGSKWLRVNGGYTYQVKGVVKRYFYPVPEVTDIRDLFTSTLRFKV